MDRYERHTYRDLSHKDLVSIPDIYGSHKRDGAAFWISFNEEGSPRFISRRPSVTGELIDRTEKLPHVADVKLPELANHVLYSELVHTGHHESGNDDHPLLSGILNSNVDKAIQAQKEFGPIRVILTDVKKPGLSTFGEKRELLKRAAKIWNKPGIVSTPEEAEGIDGVLNLLDRTKRRGDEGIIVTSLSVPENENVRYKVKHLRTYNLRVTGITQEVDKLGNPKPGGGAFTLADKTGRDVGKVGTGLSRQMRDDMFRNPKKYIGKIIQVKSMPPTRQKLRAAVYNGDADGDIDEV